MSSKFTAGPWNIHHAYPLDAPVRTTRSGKGDPPPFQYWDGTIAQGDKIIAIAQMQQSQNGGWPHVTDVEEARANALLMCAAPLMYEALKLMSQEFAEANTTGVAMALSALAKAEGKEL